MTVGTLANSLTAPSWKTRTAPDRSAKNSRPSGAKARAVALLAVRVPVGGACGRMAQGSATGTAVVAVAAVVAVVAAGAVVDDEPASPASLRAGLSSLHPAASRATTT